METTAVAENGRTERTKEERKKIPNRSVYYGYFIALQRKGIV